MMIQNNRLSNKPDTSSAQKSTLEVVTNFELWEYLLDGRTIANLSKGGKHRYTKAEAFFDLLDRQRISDSTFDDGYMNSSVLLLANAWGWMRPTAKKFLDRLEEIGAITLTPMGNRTVVRLNNIVGEGPQMFLNGERHVTDTSDLSSVTPGGVAVSHEPDEEPAATP